ncbi:MAG TPA: hemolysin family protein [Thermoanaerobaculia bacterium]|nr:hemolysin family protein [Thermoanaerobaculia bacterium]
MSLSAFQSILLALACGALFLLFDTARFFLHHVSPMRLRHWSGADPGSERGERWFQYNKRHFSLIAGVLLQGALVCGVAFTAAGLRERGILAASAGAIVIWVALVVIWKLVLALVTEHFAERALRMLIPVSNLFYYLFWPLLFPMKVVLQRIGHRREDEWDDEEASDEDVQEYIDIGEEEGIFEEGEGKLVQSIVEFGDRIAREVMTQRMEIVALSVDASLTDLANLFNESKYSRIPVYENEIDHIVGVIHIKDLFEVFLSKLDRNVRDLARPAYFVAETKKVYDLLREFQIEHLQIAVVVDEYGGTAGLISIEDLLEEIVGEIADEHEDLEEPAFVEIEEGTFLVNGLLKVETLEDVTGKTIRSGEEDYETVAGLIFKELGRVPRVGESVSRSGLRFEVDRADRKRIYRVRVQPDQGLHEGGSGSHQGER